MFENLAGRTPGYLDQEKGKAYAIIAPFLPDTQEFLFQIRSDKLHRQPGEICFPGGRIEAGEAPLEAAVRETSEELLISPENLEIVAPLDILTTPYGTTIYPFLGYLNNYGFTYNQDEVQQVFTVPFHFFLNNDPALYYNEVTTTPTDPNFPHTLLGAQPYAWGKGKYPVRFYQYGDYVIWGLTARFMHHIVELYRKTGTDGPPAS